MSLTMRPSADHAHPPIQARGQARVWLRLLFTMTVPVLWLLTGILLIR